MTTTKPKRGRTPAPLSLRLTREERQELERAAKARDQSLSAYVRQRLFRGDEAAGVDTVQGTVRMSPLERQKLLAQILAGIGSSNIGKSLSELAEAAQIGVLPLSPDVLADIRTACEHVQEIRAVLLRALGLSSERRS